MPSLLAVMNPSAHDFDARRRWPRLEPILRRGRELTLLETEPDPARTHERLKAELARRYDRVVAIGGDGTVDAVLNAIVDARPDPLPELAVIPFGTANDVAKSLRLPLDDLERLAAIATGDRLGALDVPRVRALRRGRLVVEKVWVDSVGIGMDADVVFERARYRDLGGYLAYAAALADRSLQQRSFDLVLDLDGRKFETRVFNVFVNNVPVYAGSLEMPGARRDDGLLDVYLFDRLEYGSKFLSFLTKEVDVLGLGVHEFLEDITRNQRTLHGRRVRLILASGRRLQIDGDPVGEVDEVVCEIVGQVPVVLP
jgi:diacylglycerol kinase family enzyme